jgi:hypothetical protein
MPVSPFHQYTLPQTNVPRAAGNCAGNDISLAGVRPAAGTRILSLSL